MRTAAIVLASGFSRRMGKPKLLMTYKNKPLITHVLDAITRAGRTAPNIVVATEADILEIARGAGFTAVMNPDNMIGQSASLHHGVRAAGDVDQYMFFAADMPRVGAGLISRMLAAADKRHIIVASHNRKDNFPYIFPATFRDELLQTHGDHGARQMRESNAGYIQRVEASAQEMIDVDTREDYQNLLKMEGKN